MFNATEVQLWKYLIYHTVYNISYLILTLNEANTCVTLPNACRRSVSALLSKCYHNNNGSESTVDETVEQTWDVYHVAEPVLPLISAPPRSVIRVDMKFREISLEKLLSYFEKL
jgi:peptidase E